jgi:hypothetical protein
MADQQALHAFAQWAAGWRGNEKQEAHTFVQKLLSSWEQEEFIAQKPGMKWKSLRPATAAILISSLVESTFCHQIDSLVLSAQFAETACFPRFPTILYLRASNVTSHILRQCALA